VKQSQLKAQNKERCINGQRGFSMVELVVVISLILIISAIAIIKLQPTLQDARFDVAMRQVIDQLRQAREYSITNRRYVQITFPTVVVAGGGTQYQIVMTERDDLTVGGATANPVLSTVPIQFPAQFLSFGGQDTPDAFGNSGAIEFGGVNGGPVGGMLFQSDGELVAAGTFLPVSGTVFLGIPGQPTSARAITVLGTTGRVRGWKVQF
jgi:prepilin-type N-terminal cleavage/methylation domain-containing protein